jgi:ureidoacrylate peracid hydrolase
VTEDTDDLSTDAAVSERRLAALAWLILSTDRRLPAQLRMGSSVLWVSHSERSQPMLRTLEEKVDPKHAALIIVDVQNDFCHEDSPFGRSGRDMSMAQSAARNCLRLIDAAREAGVYVIFVRATHNDDNESEVRVEERLRSHPGIDPSIYSCKEGTWGADFYLVSPRPGEPVVTKHRYSGFHGTSLDLILRSKGIRSVILGGVATGGCVESTARDAFQHDYYVTMVDDACGTYSRKSHEAALEAIGHAFGIICQTDDIINIWSRARVPAAAD